MSNSESLTTLFPNRLAAVIRWSDAEEAYQSVLAAARCGIGSVEITSGTPRAFELITRLRQEVRDSCAVGAGTITDAALARDAIAAGAQYLVTPYLVPEVAPIAATAGVFLAMGATTPTEIAQAEALGADLVKVFPAGVIGGPAYIRAIRGPMPKVPLWVSGGVGIGDIGAFLDAGVQVVALTNDLFRSDLIKAHDWAGIEKLAEQALRAVGAESAVGATA
jgi:2-dehydro-3-deoxyphosphogluconate aldolase/(4S)-4-hydroxy-2-oxoglutarate aldolase